jgi:hypothetical protein
MPAAETTTVAPKRQSMLAARTLLIIVENLPIGWHPQSRGAVFETPRHYQACQKSK